MFLNYHHLRYFRVVAKERSLTQAARLLNVSASAVSTQLRALEAELGQALFDRRRKGLVLSEAGKVALEYAESIFTTGEELVDTLARRAPGRRRVLRIGAMATLSRNFQLEFIRPALATHEVEVVLRSGNLPELVEMLENFTIEPVMEEGKARLNNHLIAEYPVSLVAAKGVKVTNEPFPLNLRHVPLVLPDARSATRAPFEALLSQAGIRPHVAAEVDDMAMLRLLAREGVGVALVPPVVVKDELEDGRLREICQVPGLRKTFHAITLRRQFPHPLAAELIARSGESLALRGREDDREQPRPKRGHGRAPDQEPSRRGKVLRK
jgi:LysR family transcriptional activator of nhaA